MTTSGTTFATAGLVFSRAASASVTVAARELTVLGSDLAELTHDSGLIAERISPRELVFHDDNVGMAGAGSQLLDLRLRQCAGQGPTRQKYSGNGSAAP
jgi:hypothetical protein